MGCGPSSLEMTARHQHCHVIDEGIATMSKISVI